MKGIAALLAIAASAATTSAFYLPGVAPTEYSYQEQVCFIVLITQTMP